MRRRGLADRADRPIRRHPFSRCMRGVVRRISPASLSIAVVCTVAISCWPSTLRTISSPLDKGAYRKVRSPSRGIGDRIVAVSEISPGLVGSALCLGQRRGNGPDRFAGALHGCISVQLERDRRLVARGLEPRLVRRGRCLPGVFRHKAFQFGLGLLVLQKGVAA